MPQLNDLDEVLVVGDGPQPAAVDVCIDYGAYYFEGPQSRCYGHAQRQFGLSKAAGTHILFMDDDDVFVPGALSVVRSAISRWPHRPMLFQFIDKHGAVLWQRPEVRQGNVGTPCFVVPNIPERLGTWGERYEGDYDFIRSTIDLWPGKDEAVVWRPNILCDCRPAPAGPRQLWSPLRENLMPEEKKAPSLSSGQPTAKEAQP